MLVVFIQINRFIWAYFHADLVPRFMKSLEKLVIGNKITKGMYFVPNDEILMKL